MTKIVEIHFTKNHIIGLTEDGRELRQSLLWYKDLFHASDDIRNDYTFRSDGIFWNQVDVQISFESFEYPDAEPTQLQRFFLTHPEINVTGFSQRFGLNPSLVRSYINGFKVPKGARLVRNSLTNRPVRVFQRATDTLIASYLQPPSGGIMPPPMPIPGNAGKKFLESLETPIEILDTDSDEICRMKEAVIVARAQIKQMMDEGQSFEAILADHYRLTEENTRIRRDAQKELDAIHAQGDAKGAEKYRRTIDLALQQMGIDPLDEPMTNAEKKRKRHLENEAKENIDQGGGEP